MLEREFGVKLLNRGTHISPTEDGARVYEEARKVVDAYGGLQEVTARKSTPTGLVRVTCPNALGTLYLIPKLKEFLRLYPEITVELRVSDAFIDLHENDIDVAIRVGEPRGDRLIAKKVCDLKRVAVGAASYFQDHAMPRKPQDLQNHACVIVGRTHGTDDWPYVTPGGARSSIEVFGRIVVDNYLALRTAVEAGLGIGLAAGFIYDGEGLDFGSACTCPAGIRIQAVPAASDVQGCPAHSGAGPAVHRLPLRRPSAPAMGRGLRTKIKKIALPGNHRGSRPLCHCQKHFKGAIHWKAERQNGRLLHL